MEKEFEALDRLKTAPSFMGGTEKYRFSTNSQATLLEDYELVKQALTTKSKKEQAFDVMKKYAVNDGWSNGWVIKFWDMNEEELKLINEVLSNE